MEEEDGDKQMGGNDYFYTSKMLDSIRHLFIKGKDRDRPIAEGQDGEQDTNDDEDNVSEVDSSILQAPKSQTPSDPASSLPPPLPAEGSSQTIRSPIRRPPTRLLLGKKTEIANQLTLNRAEFEGIDTPQSNWRFPTRSYYTYVSNSPTSLAKWLKNGSHLSYYREVIAKSGPMSTNSCSSAAEHYLSL